MLKMRGNRLIMRRIFRSLHTHAKKKKIMYPPTNGHFLRVCEVWLRASFGDLMHQVWEEFPKQKLALNPTTGAPHFMLNYLGLSRVPRYRQFFYIVNILLRKHHLSQCLRSLRIWSRKVKALR
jgi:hypothetical protein